MPVFSLDEFTLAEAFKAARYKTLFVHSFVQAFGCIQQVNGGTQGLLSA
jgi:hypothetical protein